MTLGERHWFAIQTHRGAENAVGLSLRALSIETLLPLVRRSMRQGTRTLRLAVSALFPGYLFACFCAGDSLRAVSFSRGVVRVVGTRDRPIPVDNSIIESIRERIGVRGYIELNKRPSINDRVRITSGPLAGWSGVFERELSDSQRVIILVETIRGGHIVARRDSLELADAT